MQKMLINLLLLTSFYAISSSIALAATDTTQLTPAQVKAIVGTVMVQKYNTAKTSAALIGKTFVGTLEMPRGANNGGAEFSDAITTKALGKASIYFACNDYPKGFPTNIKTYMVNTKITKFAISYAGDSDDVATITLDQCKTNAANSSNSERQAVLQRTTQSPNTAQLRSIDMQKTLDDQFNARKSAECPVGFTGLICHEKIRFAMCNDKWSDNPPLGQSACKTSNMK